MKRHFDEDLAQLKERLLRMGGSVERMIHLSAKDLFARTEADRAELEKLEREVNDLQIVIDDRALKLIALRQPMATDLRFLFMASRISSDLERIADQAINIIETTHHLIAGGPPLVPLVDLPLMAEICQEMLREALDGFVRQDASMARKVLEMDDKVDACKRRIFDEMLAMMESDQKTIRRGLCIVLISRNLERIGDHATNIAEEVIYMVEARDVRHHHGEGAAPGAPAE
ncbi:MAG: phosphate signaling complex protein PhoU [Planctomycetes bacterium]|nr:phosphate signaling complex protein PhoU [Planctomycetota bacterium]